MMYFTNTGKYSIELNANIEFDNGLLNLNLKYKCNVQVLRKTFSLLNFYNDNFGITERTGSINCVEIFFTCENGHVEYASNLF